MAGIEIRAANRADLPRLTEIYNYYVINTPITFDIEPYTVERRGAWFEQFALSGRHRLLVAEENGQVIGYAGTMRFRVSPHMTPQWRPQYIAPRTRQARELARNSMRHSLH